MSKPSLPGIDISSITTSYLFFRTFSSSSFPELASSATTNPASSVSCTSATLNGTVNANGSSTTVTFEYGTTTSYGSTITATPSPVTGSTATSVSANLSGLATCTTYHFRVKAVSAGGTTYGEDQTFTTLCGPSATTNPATSVSCTSATLNGTVNANGSSTTVTFEYGPTTAYGSTITATQSPVTGSTATSVSANLTGLSGCTIYHYRVKAVNTCGTVYGSDQTFTTLCGPSATTAAATSVSLTSATLNGIVNANGSSTTVTFEYGTTTSYGSTATATPSPVTGNTVTNVSANITGLQKGTLYHFRVKVENICGIIYGNDLTFSTSINDIEDNIYQTVQIGDQLWMKENLKTTHYNNGDIIVTTNVDSNWETFTWGGYRWYNNDPATYKNVYGALYNGYAVQDSRGICPTGWHVPRDIEWTQLENFLGGKLVAGRKLKESGTIHWASPNGTNESGFTALPGGICCPNFSNIRIDAFFWASDYINQGQMTYGRYLTDSSDEISDFVMISSSGNSVRCIKNQ